MSKSNAKHKEYVCPNCFNMVDECTCEYMPYHLIWIDSGIQEHVRILNQKGYRTRESCESHNQRGNMYISFAFDYGFGDSLPLPKHFKRMKRDAVSFMYDRKTTDDEFVMQKKERLADLLEWCKKLPIQKENLYA